VKLTCAPSVLIPSGPLSGDPGGQSVVEEEVANNADDEEQ
jgi:hypothetical protein